MQGWFNVAWQSFKTKKMTKAFVLCKLIFHNFGKPKDDHWFALIQQIALVNQILADISNPDAGWLMTQVAAGKHGWEKQCLGGEWEEWEEKRPIVTFKHFFCKNKVARGFFTVKCMSTRPEKYKTQPATHNGFAYGIFQIWVIK